MNAPAQILSALAAAVALAFLPLSGRFQEAASLEAAAAKKDSAEKERIAAEATIEPKVARGTVTDGGGFAVSSIAPGVSAAEASAIVLELSNLEGKMMSSRQLFELLDKVMSLPASHMKEASAVIGSQKNLVYGAFLSAALFSRWGELDPNAARVQLEQDNSGNPVTKFVGSASLAGGWLEKDPDGFIKWAVDAGADGDNKDPKQDEMKRMMLDAVVSGMAELDSGTMERLIAAAPAERRPTMILNMAQNDPDANPMDVVLRAYAEAGDSQSARDSINWRAGRILAEKDPQEAIKFAEEHQRPEERSATYEAAMNAWVKKDKDDAMKWLKGQPEDAQANAVRGLRGEVKELDYDSVAKLTGDLQPKAANSVWEMAMRETAEKDPAKAVDYLENITPEQRPGSYTELSTNWTKKDPEAASEWVDSLEPGKEKDSAITGMVRELGSKEPDSSTIWASTISDPVTRVTQVTAQARNWLRRDEGAATEWINATETLTPQLKEEIIKAGPAKPSSGGLWPMRRGGRGGPPPITSGNP